MKKFLLTYTYCLFLLYIFLSRGHGSSAIVRYYDGRTHQEESTPSYCICPRPRPEGVRSWLLLDSRHPQHSHAVYPIVRRRWWTNIRLGAPVYLTQHALTNIYKHTFCETSIKLCFNLSSNNRAREIESYDIISKSCFEKKFQVYIIEMRTDVYYYNIPHNTTNPFSINHDVRCLCFIYVSCCFGCLQSRQPYECVYAPVMWGHGEKFRVALASAKRSLMKEVPSTPIVSPWL